MWIRAWILSQRGREGVGPGGWRPTDQRSPAATNRRFQLLPPRGEGQGGRPPPLPRQPQGRRGRSPASSPQDDPTSPAPSRTAEATRSAVKPAVGESCPGGGRSPASRTAPADHRGGGGASRRWATGPHAMSRGPDSVPISPSPPSPPPPAPRPPGEQRDPRHHGQHDGASPVPDHPGHSFWIATPPPCPPPLPWFQT